MIVTTWCAIRGTFLLADLLKTEREGKAKPVPAVAAL